MIAQNIRRIFLCRGCYCFLQARERKHQISLCVGGRAFINVAYRSGSSELESALVAFFLLRSRSFAAATSVMWTHRIAVQDALLPYFANGRAGRISVLRSAGRFRAVAARRQTSAELVTSNHVSHATIPLRFFPSFSDPVSFRSRCTRLCLLSRHRHK